MEFDYFDLKFCIFDLKVFNFDFNVCNFDFEVYNFDFKFCIFDFNVCNFCFIYPSRRQNLPPILEKKIPKFSIFFQNFQFFYKIFNFFQNFQKKFKFSEIFKISKITIDFEYFPNIFRSIINNHNSWKFG